MFGIFLGTLFANTALDYIQDNVGWALGYGFPTLGLAVSVAVFLAGTPFYRHRLSQGSPFAKMARVIVAAARKRRVPLPDDSKQVPVPSIRRLLLLNAPEWKQAALGLTSATLFGAIQPLYAFAMGSVIAVYFFKDHDQIRSHIRTYASIFVSLAFFSLAVNVCQHYNFAHMGEQLTKRVRERMLSKILTFEVAWFDQDKNSTGAVCSRLATDANVVRSLVGHRMARRVLLKNMSARGIKAQSESSKLAAEAVSNLRTITAFSSQERILQQFDAAQEGPRRAAARQSWYTGVGLGTSQSLMACTWSLDFWYGGRLVAHGYITAKALFQTFMLLVNTGRVIADAGSMTTDLAKGADAVGSVFAVLDLYTRIEPEDPDGHRPERLTSGVEFRGVEFA